MKLGATKQLILLILFMLLFKTALAGSETVFTEINSALITGDLVEVNSLLDHYRKSKSYKPVDSIKVNKLTHIINYKSIYPFDEEKKINQYINSQLKLEPFYTSASSGYQATELFQKFKSLHKTDKVEAVKYFLIAQYFNDLKLNNKIENARATVIKAKQLYRDKKYKEANDLLNENEIIAGNNPILFDLKQQADKLKDKIKVALKSIEDKEKFWDSSEFIEGRFILSGGFSIINQPENKDYNVETRFNTEPVEINLRNSQQKYNFGGEIEFLYLLNNNLGLAADLSISKMNYSSEFDGISIKYDFNLNTHSFHLKTVYYFRKGVGVRPFLSIGAGQFGYHLSDGEEIKITHQISINEEITQIYNTIEKKFSTMQYISDLGFQIVFDKQKSKVVTIKTTLSYNDKKDNYLKQFNYGFNLSVGYLF